MGKEHTKVRLLHEVVLGEKCSFPHPQSILCGSLLYLVTLIVKGWSVPVFVLCGCVIVMSLVRSITITVHITPALHSITCSLKPPDADPREGEDGADIDR